MNDSATEKKGKVQRITRSNFQRAVNGNMYYLGRYAEHGNCSKWDKSFNLIAQQGAIW